MFADRKPHHPFHFPPQGVINSHLELRWESQNGYVTAGLSKPTPMHSKTLDDPSPHVVYRSWSSPAFTGPQVIWPRAPPQTIWPPAPPHGFASSRALLPASGHAPPRPHKPRASLTISAVWLSGQTLMLSQRQNANSSLEPLSRASALLRRTWGGA